MPSAVDRLDIPTAAPAVAASGLSRDQRRNLAFASLGTLLEFYEFTLFGFFTIIIGQLFFPPDTPVWVRELQAFAIFALGYFVRPLSGVVIGHLGDKFGRKKLFMFTVFMMAVPTGLMGLLPTYAQIGVAAPVLLLVLRLCQGLAVAGEVAGAAVFVTEHVPGRRIGWACGWLFGCTYLAYFLGAAVGALTANLLDPETLRTIGWRIPFLIGGIFGLVAVYLRRSLDETPLFEEIRKTKALAKAFPFGEVMRKHRPAAVFVLGLAGYLGSMVTTVYFYLPSFLQTQYGLPREVVFNANAVALLFLALMCPVWGFIADRIGLAKVLGIGAALNVIVAFLFFQAVADLPQAPANLFWWYLAFSAAMSTAVTIPALAALVFPTQVRFTGFALGYNVGAALFAGTAPVTVAWLAHYFGHTAVLVYLIGAGLLGIVLCLAAPRLRLYPREG